MKAILFLLLPLGVFSQVQRGSGYVIKDARGKPMFVDTAQTRAVILPEDLKFRLREAEKLSVVIDNLIMTRDRQRDSAMWVYYENQVKQAVVEAEKLKGKTRDERLSFMAAWNEKQYGANVNNSIREADVKTTSIYAPRFDK